MHAAAVNPDHRLGQERCGESHVGGNLAADQLVELDLVGGRDNFAITVVDFELRRRNFGMIFFVLKTHRSLHFGGGVNKSAQRIARERVVISTGIHILEFASFVILAFGVRAFEQETFNFVRGIERITFFLAKFVGIIFLNTPRMSAE